jgi:hypothetical protein
LDGPAVDRPDDGRSALAAVGQAGMRPHTTLPGTAATRHHYFELGKRHCVRTIKRLEAETPGQQVAVAISINVAG